MSKPKISIIGLGKLGAPMVAAYASKGYRVIGVDVNPRSVQLINEARPPVFEPRLAEFLEANKERISATQNYEEAVLNSDITFIIVPTPSELHGGFSNKYIVEVAKEIGSVLKKKSDFHLVNLVSTVVPGSTENVLKPTLEEYSGKKCGEDFGLCYNPEFIALGNVIEDLLYPDFVLIGEFNKKSGDVLENFYENFCPNNPPIKRLSIINAEISKIALNTFVTTKISYANMMAELCEKIPGADVDAVTDAIGCDKRIGHRYLKGALGYGGPCFPRDNRALVYSARRFGVNLPIAEATDTINRNQVPRIKEIILSVLPQNGKVGILGLSYKPDTNVIERSQALEIAKTLSEDGVSVVVYDPKAMENAKKVLGGKSVFVDSAKECIQEADVIVIAVPCKEFKDIEPVWLEGKTVLDCWKTLEPEKLKNVRYLAIGKYLNVK